MTDSIEGQRRKSLTALMRASAAYAAIVIFAHEEFSPPKLGLVTVKKEKNQITLKRGLQARQTVSTANAVIMILNRVISTHFLSPSSLGLNSSPNPAREQIRITDSVMMIKACVE